MNYLNVSNLAMVMVAGLAMPTLANAALASPKGDAYSHLSEKLVLNATIRDFRASYQAGGHPDFQAFGNSNITIDLVKAQLASDSKPEFQGKSGLVVTKEFKDSKGRNIYPRHYGKPLWQIDDDGDDKDDDRDDDDYKVKGKSDDNKGKNDFKKSTKKFRPVKVDDSEGKLSPAGTTGSVNQLTSAERFAQWYSDVPGVNMSKTVPLTFNRVAGTNRYVMDSAKDEPWKSMGGFFPINGDLFGNFESWNKNFHFTTQIETEFVFERGKGHVFTFSGDDDVWVFIGDQLVLDLGGLHPRREQTVELDRLDFLEDNRAYKLRVFHAERHTSESNFRIETTLVLRNAELPDTSNLFD